MRLPTFRNMPATQSQKDLARNLLERHGIMRLSELKALGIHAPTLSRLVEEGTVARRLRARQFGARYRAQPGGNGEARQSARNFDP